MQDFFLAKRFDADKDGKLSEAELEAAKKAVSQEGFLDQFLFGLERSAPMQPDKPAMPKSGKNAASARKNQNHLRVL